MTRHGHFPALRKECRSRTSSWSRRPWSSVEVIEGISNQRDVTPPERLCELAEGKRPDSNIMSIQGRLLLAMAAKDAGDATRAEATLKKAESSHASFRSDPAVAMTLAMFASEWLHTEILLRQAQTQVRGNESPDPTAKYDVLLGDTRSIVRLTSAVRWVESSSCFASRSKCVRPRHARLGRPCPRWPRCA